MSSSVTEILQSAGLIDTRWFNDEARDRGDRVHNYLQWYDETGQFNDDYMDVIGYLKSYMKFRAENPVRWQYVERTFTHPTQAYHGTIDRYGKLINRDKNLLLDIKTGAYQPWHDIQIAAYSCILGIHNGFVDEHWGLYLKDNGTYSVHKYQNGKYQENIAVFLAALRIHNWRQKHGRG